MRGARGKVGRQKSGADFGLQTSDFELSRSEGASTAAGRFRVRIVEHEPFADHVRVVIEHGAVQKQKALLVDVNRRAFRPLEHFIAQARLLLPGKRIAQPRTPAALHADAQSALVEALPGHQRADLARRALADLDHVMPSAGLLLPPTRWLRSASSCSPRWPP